MALSLSIKMGRLNPLHKLTLNTFGCFFDWCWSEGSPDRTFISVMFLKNSRTSLITAPLFIPHSRTNTQKTPNQEKLRGINLENCFF